MMRIFIIMKECSILAITIFSLITLYAIYSMVYIQRNSLAISSLSFGIFFFKFIAFAEGENIAAKMNKSNIEQMETYIRLLVSDFFSI